MLTRMSLGKKHPWALGRPSEEVWEEIWGDIGPRIRKFWRVARPRGMRRCSYSWSGVDIVKKPTTRSPTVRCPGTTVKLHGIYV